MSIHPVKGPVLKNRRQPLVDLLEPCMVSLVHGDMEFEVQVLDEMGIQSKVAFAHLPGWSQMDREITFPAFDRLEGGFTRGKQEELCSPVFRLGGPHLHQRAFYQGHFFTGEILYASDRFCAVGLEGDAVHVGMADGEVHGRPPLVGDGHIGQGVEPALLKIIEND